MLDEAKAFFPQCLSSNPIAKFNTTLDLDLHLLSSKPYAQETEYLRFVVLCSVNHFTNDMTILFGTTF